MAKLITKVEMTRLLANGAKSNADPAFSPAPVIKLFNPTGGQTWLISSIDPENPDFAFGLCDLGCGCPELGSVSISELSAIRGRFGLPLERDRWFRPKLTMSAYCDSARREGRIVA